MGGWERGAQASLSGGMDSRSLPRTQDHHIVTEPHSFRSMESQCRDVLSKLWLDDP